AFQYPSQLKTEDMKVYKSVKNNARNKIVFATADRQEALELADDFFDHLTAPEVKFMHQHLNHRLVDVRQKSFTQSQSHGQSRGISRTNTAGWGTSRGSSQTSADSESYSDHQSEQRSHTDGQSRTEEHAEGASHT